MAKDVSVTVVAICDDVRYTLDLLKNKYGANDYSDSRNNAATRQPTRLVKLPKLNTEVGVPLNQRDISLYLRNIALDGKPMKQKISTVMNLEIKEYGLKNNPARSVKNSAYLANECILLRNIDRKDVAKILELFFTEKSAN